MKATVEVRTDSTDEYAWLLLLYVDDREAYRLGFDTKTEADRAAEDLVQMLRDVERH